jgi:predicted acyltransferase
MSKQNTARLLSLDALRGFDMFWIMSGEHIIHELAKATGWPVFIRMSAQLNHTVWNGITFYDMIFPLFLFISGISMPYSVQKRMQAAGVTMAFQLPKEEKKKMYLSMLRRTFILLMLGLIVNGLFAFKGYHNIRFASVLGRIGLAWFFAGIIYLNNDVRKQIYWLLLLLFGYWAMMEFIPVPGYGAGVLTMDGSLESYIDRLLLPGRLHDGVHDPEGILSTIPAIGTALMGILTGTFLRREKFSMPEKALSLFLSGIILISLGLLWDSFFPINKRLWTSSFVVYVGGWSVLLLSVFYWIIDVVGWRRWAFPFIIIGTNSILIYMCAEGLVNFGYTADYIFGGMIRQAAVLWQPVLIAISVTALQLMFLYLLYRNKLFLKV